MLGFGKCISVDKVHSCCLVSSHKASDAFASALGHGKGKRREEEEKRRRRRKAQEKGRPSHGEREAKEKEQSVLRHPGPSQSLCLLERAAARPVGKWPPASRPVRRQQQKPPCRRKSSAFVTGPAPSRRSTRFRTLAQVRAGFGRTAASAGVDSPPRQPAAGQTKSAAVAPRSTSSQGTAKQPHAATRRSPGALRGSKRSHHENAQRDDNHGKPRHRGTGTKHRHPSLEGEEGEPDGLCRNECNR